MFVQEIWRYPVKSMAGELMQSAHLSSQGIEGDRVVQVQGARGRVLTSRTHPKLLGLRATLGNQGVPAGGRASLERCARARSSARGRRAGGNARSLRKPGSFRHSSFARGHRRSHLPRSVATAGGFGRTS